MACRLYFLMQMTVAIVEAAEPNNCPYVYDTTFRHCSEVKSRSLNNNTGLQTPTTTKMTLKAKMRSCIRRDVCSRVFKVTQVDKDHEFGAEILDMISTMMSRCCGACSKLRVNDLEFSLPHSDERSLKSSDILYPVLGRASLHDMYNFHFIPVFELPYSYLFTLEPSPKEMVSKIILSCLSMWPLFVICLLFALISGFIMWALETVSNPEHFPRQFVLGLFAGFWWSFISMTTVGYGDKAPRRPAGRIFAVVWILIGITITSIYIGYLAGAIVNMQAPPQPVINSKLIGGLKHQLQDATIVAQHGGILRDVDIEDKIAGMAELIYSLKNKTLDGIVINKATYLYFTRALESEPKYKEIAINVKEIHMIRSELDFRGEKVVGGILVKSEHDYEYFRKYFENNWLQIQACHSFRANAKDQSDAVTSTSHVHGLFYPFFYGTLIILGAIFCFGFFYETHRNNREEKAYDLAEKMKMHEN